MIHTNNQKVKEAISEIHKGMLRKTERRKTEDEAIVMENRIFSTICHDFDMSPSRCASRLNERYGYSLTGDTVIQVFRNRKMANPVERKELLQWADRVAGQFAGAVDGDRAAFDRFERCRKEPALKNGKKHKSQERLAAIMIFEKYPELDLFDDAGQLSFLGDTLAKYFFFDMADAVGSVYGFSQLRDEKKKTQEPVQEEQLTYEEALRRIKRLETALERTDAMLQDLQDEFEEQLEADRIKELAEFFARLNSEKYGCILDELLVVRKGMDKLRRDHYELPIEINGLLIMVKKLIQFVRDSHIEPIMKPGSVKQVTAVQVEFCDYEGRPFSSADDVRTVKVISPGWIYKDKEIQISRPKVKEENHD